MWFPTMTQLSGGALCANFSTNLDAIVADRTSSVSWSADDGLTWSEPSSIMPKGDLYAETRQRLKNGDEMEVLFTLLAERYERGSVLLTSNLPFSKWDQIFKDTMTTAAAIDRLVHHSVIIELNVPSFRVETAQHSKSKGQSSTPKPPVSNP